MSLIDLIPDREKRTLEIRINLVTTPTFSRSLEKFLTLRSNKIHRHPDYDPKIDDMAVLVYHCPPSKNFEEQYSILLGVIQNFVSGLLGELPRLQLMVDHQQLVSAGKIQNPLAVALPGQVGGL